MSNTDRLETLNDAQHAAGDAWFAARRTLVRARTRVDALRAAEPREDWPGDEGVLVWRRVFDAALEDRAELAQDADEALAAYVAAVDAFFAELDPPAPDAGAWEDDFDEDAAHEQLGRARQEGTLS
jgi:hypothetical protein